MTNRHIGSEILTDIVDEIGSNNLIKGRALTIGFIDAQAIGIENAELGHTPESFVIEMGDGNDTVDGKAIAAALEEAFADGVYNTGEMRLGERADRLNGSGLAITVADGQLTIATGINSTGRGVIRGEDGKDLIQGHAAAVGQNDVGAFGVLTTDLTTNQGNDAVVGTAIASGISSTDARGISVGFSDIDDDTTAGNPPEFAPTASGTAAVGRLLTGEGDDLVKGSANVVVEAEDGDEIFFAGANGIVNDGGMVDQLETLLASTDKTLNNFAAADVEQIVDQLDTSMLGTGPGDDRLIAEVTLQASQDGQGADSDLEVIGDGIENAGTVLLGQGDDSVNSTVSVETDIAGAKGLADALDNSSVGIITGLELEVNNETLFDLGDGDDTFTSDIFATAVDDLSAADGLGNRGVLVAGAGDDTFHLKSLSEFVLENEDDTEQQEGIADGWENRSRVFLDDQAGHSSGHDSVTTSAIARGEGVLTIAEGLESRELFDAGGGNDTFALTAEAITGADALVDNLTQAAGLQTEQIDEGEFLLGDGDNTVVGQATATSEAVAGLSEGESFTPSTFAFGITQMTADANNTNVKDGTGLIEAGNGRDRLDGTATASGQTDVASFGLLLENTTTEGGEDTLSGKAVAESEDVAIASGIAVGLDEAVFAKQNSVNSNSNSNNTFDYGLGAEAGHLDTGADDDTLLADATAVAADEAVARGIDGANGNIDLGAGDDAVVAEATATAKSRHGAIEAVGIFGGTINTGDGHDMIKTRSNDHLAGSNGIELKGGQGFGGDAVVNLEGGNDVLLGFGDAEVDGGKGIDTLKFEFTLSDFIVGGGSINFLREDFTFGGVTLKTHNFEQIWFNVDFDSQSLGASDGHQQSHPADESPQQFNSFADLEHAVTRIE